MRSTRSAKTSNRKMIAQKQKAICVLGMHRSGTSAVARAINLLGAYIGPPEKMMPPKADNPEGFWEHADIVDLHERLLQTLSRSWNDPFPLPEEWWKQPEIEPYRQELTDLIQREFADRLLWMWKDPRTCLLLPLWTEVLNALEVEVCYVISVRNPLDVAASLERREEFRKSKSLALCQLYNLSAFFWTDQSRRLVLHYDALLEDWESCLKHVAETFDISWPLDEGALRATLATFLKPELRHSHSDLDALARDGEVMESVVVAYRLFLDAANSTELVDSEKFAEKIAKLYVDYCAYAKMIEAQQPSTARVYWLPGQVFSEENSACVGVTSDGNFHYYDLPIPLEINGALRLDPVDCLAYVEIKSIELVSDGAASPNSRPVVCWAPGENFHDLVPGANIIQIN